MTRAMRMTEQESSYSRNNGTEKKIKGEKNYYQCTRNEVTNSEKNGVGGVTVTRQLFHQEALILRLFTGSRILYYSLYTVDFYKS